MHVITLQNTWYPVSPRTEVLENPYSPCLSYNLTRSTSSLNPLNRLVHVQGAFDCVSNSKTIIYRPLPMNQEGLHLAPSFWRKSVLSEQVSTTPPFTQSAKVGVPTSSTTCLSSVHLPSSTLGLLSLPELRVHCMTDRQCRGKAGTRG